jgi:hypothetical protein
LSFLLWERRGPTKAKKLSLQLSDPVDLSFFVRSKASFKNMLKSREIIAIHVTLRKATVIATTADSPESYSTSSCGYEDASSAVVAIILLEKI